MPAPPRDWWWTTNCHQTTPCIWTYRWDLDTRYCPSSQHRSDRLFLNSCRCSYTSTLPWTAQQERELSISYSSGKVYEVFLSTFQLDDGGQPTSLDSITCTSDKNQTPECLISDTPYGAHVSIKLATPSYATIQVTLNARANELPAQQSTWLL